jgi:predicted DNA binding protein
MSIREVDDTNQRALSKVQQTKESVLEQIQNFQLTDAQGRAIGLALTSDQVNEVMRLFNDKIISF